MSDIKAVEVDATPEQGKPNGNNGLSLSKLMGISALGLAVSAVVPYYALKLLLETYKTFGASDEISDELSTKIGSELAKKMLERPASLPLNISDELNFVIESSEGVDGGSTIYAVLIDKDYYSSCPKFHIQVDHNYKTIPVDIDINRIVCLEEYDSAYDYDKISEDIQDEIKTELRAELAKRPAYLPLKALNSDGPASEYRFSIATAEGKDGRSLVTARFANTFENCAIFNVDVDHRKKDTFKPDLIGKIQVCPSLKF